jgi:UrcA family protein
MKTLVLTAALVAIAAIAAPATALAGVDTYSARIRFSDLQLDQPADADLMIQRIRSAALKVCGQAPAGRELRDRQSHSACLSATMDAAVQQVNAPLVRARYGLPIAARIAAR